MSKIHNIKYILFLFILLLAVNSCTTKQEQPFVQEPEKEELPMPDVTEEPEVIIMQDEPEVILSDSEPEIEPAEQDEYNRSVSELKDEVIPQDVFENDKKTILHIIDDLAEIMIKKDYRKWINYISPQSLDYWQKSSNLEAVSARLPVKGISLRNLEDYFRLVFIPSRLNVTVDEIRYISSTSVKVVQVRGDQDIICYYFEKINDEWMLILDTL